MFLAFGVLRIMPRRQFNKALLGFGLGAVLLGAGIAIPIRSSFNPSTESLPWAEPSLEDEASLVLPLVMEPTPERASTLEAIATDTPLPGDTKPQPITELDRLRARYLLATDFINQDRGGSALPLLENLEEGYPTLTVPILLKRAQAQAATGNQAAAQETWRLIVENYAESPLAAEALYQLGKDDVTYWEQAIANYPAHPRTIDIAQAQLEAAPDRPDLLLLIAHHGLYVPNAVDVLDRLVTEYGDQLQPDDWEAIGFGYWEKWQYGKAGSAYAKAPATALNRYRAGRGAQLVQRNETAIAAYKRLIAEFPDAADTAQGLIRLSQLVPSEEAIGYLDRVRENFPDRAADALLERAKHLESLQSQASAEQARESVLNQYSDSEAAADLRWQYMESAIENNDVYGAWKWASQLVVNNPDDDRAPEAGFWVGKWATQLDRDEDARKAYTHVLKSYPDSYYAWRSANYLGWDVGDFTSVRVKNPELIEPTVRMTLPQGSETLKELHRLGQDKDAWGMWQVEFQSSPELTTAEQFTDGIMRLGVGDHLAGIFMMSSLDWRPEDTDDFEFDTAKQTSAYWQALYPFPFQDIIVKWSAERRLNPVLVTALIRQESRFEPQIQSVANAAGLMQVIPSTASWISQQTGIADYDMTNPESNINFGTWYLDYTHREYDNNSLFAIASYNAGPGSVANWINRFGFSDPDVFVEQIPFPETKGYVEAVFENYWNYLRIYNPAIAQQLAELSPEQAAIKDTTTLSFDVD
ncbi:MAG: transglycosylase SLT domain-containing protein [Cyanobacteria bacterium J06633_2]